MSKEKQILSEFLKNLRKGLKVCDLEELNKTIEGLLEKIKNDDSVIEDVLNVVCEEYKLLRNELLHSTQRGEIQEARRIAICLMFFNSNISIRKIANGVFNREYHLFIQKAIKRHKTLNVNIKPDKQYKDKYDKLEQIIKTKKYGN